MPRFAFKIEYDGRPFTGWQRQAETITVQGQIEAALEKLEDGPHTFFGAGRTDTGVHAEGQVGHVDLQKPWQADRLRQAINHHLKPDPIALTAAVEVDGDFHARFGAVERTYRFEIVARRAPIVRDRGFVWHIGHALDVGAMRAGAAHLIGNHDFTTFRSTMCQAQSPIKTLDGLDIDVADYPGGGIKYTFSIVARSFLHNQVRSFIGTLERVGSGAWHPDQVKDALESKDRQACGPVSPPDGLTLVHVRYPNSPFNEKN